MIQEILFLNLLRFFAALNVIGVHKFDTLLSVGYLPSFLEILSPLTRYGYLGVDLFFIISGFVITLSSEGRTARQFISARFIRLYPVFWVCVSITTLILIVTTSQHISLAQYLAGLTMSPDSFGTYAYIDGAYWTLEVELKFYFFIAVLLALRSCVQVNIQKVALVMSYMLAVHMIFHVTHLTSIPAIILGLIFSIYWTGYAQYFLAGILFYGLYQNSRQPYHYVALLLCYLAAVTQALSRSYDTNNKIVIALFVTLFFGLFLLLSLKKVTNTSFSFLGRHSRKIIITLGAITYPLYLLQNSVIEAIVKLFTSYHLSPYIASPLLVLGVLSIVLLVNKIDRYSTAVWKRKQVTS